MMTKTLVWTQIATEDGRAPHPPEFHVSAGDKMELYIVREESEEKPMIYAVNKRTKDHYTVPCAGYMRSSDWRYIKRDPDGWIEWKEGGGNPLPEDTRCDVLLWGRKVVPNVIAHSNASWEGVTHYRPILDADTKPEPPAWDGDGSPPIGTPVKVRTKECDSAAVVLANDHNIVVVRYESALGFKYGGFDRLDVRPIRSEEDRAVEEMVRDLAATRGALPRFRLKHYARILYKAGYRKTGGE